MKLKQTLWNLCSFAMLTALTTTLNAQVTIGSGEAPNKGALLDLKQEQTTDGSANSKKGLGLPRVKLLSSTITSGDGNLATTIENATDVWDKNEHVGLVVYNTTLISPLCPGFSVWTGDYWEGLNKACYYLDVAPQVLNFRKTPQGNKSIGLDFYPTSMTHSFARSGGMQNSADWVVFPVDGQSNSSYNFQPTVNNTGISRSTTVTVSGVYGGIRKSQNVIINQAKDDLVLDYKLVTYPGQGGAQSFNVSSLVPWKVSGSNNDAIFNSYVTTEIASGTNPYNFNLKLNPTWAERHATFTAVSTDPDFVPQTITITQGHDTPILTIDKTSISEISGTQTAKITTNANWIFTADAAFVNVVATSNLQANITLTGGTPYNSQAMNLNLTSATNNTAPAGTTYSTELKFNTQNTNPASGALEKKLTITRKVPVIFIPVTPTLTTIDATSQTLAVTASTNADWNMQATGTTISSMAASTLGNKTLNVTLPARLADTDGWTNNKSISVDVWNNVANKTKYNYTQSPWSLNCSANTTPVNIPRAGATYNFTMAGTTPSNFVLKAIYNDGATTTTTTAGGIGTRALTVTANNNSWNNRLVTFHFARNGYTDQQIVQRTQLGADISLHSFVSPIGTISAIGENVTVKLKSTSGSLATTMQAMYGIGTVSLVKDVPVISAGGNVDVIVPIYPTHWTPNFSSTRQIDFYVYQGATKKWVAIGSKQQVSFTLSATNGNILSGVDMSGGATTNRYYVGTSTVTSCPDFRVVVSTGKNAAGDAPVGLLWTSGYAGTGNRYFSVPAHPGGASGRILYFWVERSNSNNTTNSWILVTDIFQVPWSIP